MRGIVSKRIIIIFALIFLNACLATHYDVRVNGYTGGESVQFNKNKIFVFKNDSATNSLLEAEIGNNIEKALRTSTAKALIKELKKTKFTDWWQGLLVMPYKN